MNALDYQAMFLQECAEHLRVLEDWVCQPDAIAGTREEIATAFRSIHSIKGGAGMFGFARGVPLAHAYETLLDRLRNGETALTPDIKTALTKGTDCLTDLVEAEQKGITLPPSFEILATQTLSRMAGIDEASKSAVMPQATGVLAEPDVAERTVLIHFMPFEQLLRRACEPLHVVKQLRDMGALTLTVDDARVPDFATHDPSDAWLGWFIALETGKPLSAIREAFEFVADDALVNIQDLAPSDDILAANVAAAEAADEPTEDIGSSFNTAVAFAAAGVAPLNETKADSSNPVPNTAETVAKFGQRQSDRHEASSIRVDVARIDNLVNLAGEIAISQAMVAQLIDQSLFSANPQLFQELSQLLVHTQSLQENVMAIRAQPVRTVFERMPRLVRDLATQLNKDIALRLSGEATEIDKTVIEQLADPIVHMLRNACDHGIETSDVRLRNGKAAQGQITLHAEQRGSNIVIEISDDGRGLDRVQILERASARGIVAAGANLQPEEIDNLIFLPGFSTAEKVTTLSGRGVGMDVVKRNVQKFGGKVAIRSQAGLGSTITMSLPLTLAVMEGMVLRCGDERFVLPVNNIQECRSNWQKDTGLVPGTGLILNFRGRHIALHDLRELFGTTGPRTDATTAIIAEVENNSLAAFIVDEIVGQQQVVVKNIMAHAEPVKGIAGATILGDGRVALILDPGEVVRLKPSANAGHARLSGTTGPVEYRRQVA